MLTDFYRSFRLLRKDRTTDQFATDASNAQVGVYQGFLQPVSGNESFEHFKADERVTHRLFTGVSVPAKAGDYIEWEGELFTVIYSLQASGISSIDHHKEILCGRYGNGS